MELDSLDIAKIEKLSFTLQGVADELAGLDNESGTIWGALRDVTAQLADDSVRAVRENVPHGETNDLADSVRMEAFERAKLAFMVSAGVKNSAGDNYGWFTELGTDDAAAHAVDAIGYQHRHGRSTGEHRGIPAQYWMSKSVGGVVEHADELVDAAVSDALIAVLNKR